MPGVLDSYVDLVGKGGGVEEGNGGSHFGQLRGKQEGLPNPGGNVHMRSLLLLAQLGSCLESFAVSRIIGSQRLRSCCSYTATHINVVLFCSLCLFT